MMKNVTCAEIGEIIGDKRDILLIGEGENLIPISRKALDTVPEDLCVGIVHEVSDPIHVFEGYLNTETGEVSKGMFVCAVSSETVIVYLPNVATKIF